MSKRLPTPCDELKSSCVVKRDVLVVVDVLNDFEHEDGERLLDSLRARQSGLTDAVEKARANGTPVVYVNDHLGDWSAGRQSLVERAERGKGGGILNVVMPLPSEALLVKARYSAFDHTAQELLLRELGAERILLAGGSTEGCIVQTGIDGRELGFKVTILTSACMTVDESREAVALRYAREVAGIFLEPNEVEND
jgi:nicotinamidase-related amidase